MDVESLQRAGMPDPRDYVTYTAYLLDWCAAQPDRSTTDKIKELARLAGCSPTQMHYVLQRRRQLTLAQGRELAAKLVNDEAQRAHLLTLFELAHLPTALSRKRREKLLSEMAARRGVSWGTPAALVQDQPTDAAALAALSAAIGAFEAERPTLAQLTDALVPPCSSAALEAALGAQSPAERVGPRLWRLGPANAQNGAAHQGLLSFASDALLRLGRKDRNLRAYWASVDEQGFLALQEQDRRVEADLAALADEVELRVPTDLSVLLTQRLVVAGPFSPGAMAADPGWSRDTIELPLAGQPKPPAAPSNPRAPGLPHPAGATHFPSFMASWRAAASARGLPHSERWLATQTGLYPGTVHDLLTGTQRFTAEHVAPFMKPLGLIKDELGELALAGMALVAAPDDPRQRFRVVHHLRGMAPGSEGAHPDSDAYYRDSQWFVGAICALASLGVLRAHPGWVCRALRGQIDWDTAERALTIMARLGLIARDSQGRTVYVEPVSWVEGPHKDLAGYEQHLGLLSLLRGELGHGSRDLGLQAWLFARPKVADRRLEQILDRWDADTTAALAAAEARRVAGSPSDRVVLISRQCFPVFRDLDPRRRMPRSSRKTRT